MTNGGITPDCVHCKFYRGRPLGDGEPYCDYHKMQLASPIYVFCSNQQDAEPDGEHWLDQELDRTLLRDDMMYLWLGGHDKPFFHMPLAPIPDYWHWTWDKFLDEMVKLKEKYEDKGS